MSNEQIYEYLNTHFPVWDLLSQEEREQLCKYSISKTYNKGETIYRSHEFCKGIMLVVEGQLRPYILSEDGREITLFRVKSGEICVLTASCLMDSIIFDVSIDTMEKTNVIIIPSERIQNIMENHIELELYMYKNSTEKFSDVMWLIQQILFHSADKRVAHFLWDEFSSTKNPIISYTHEEIAKLIGSAREVVSRVVKYLAEDEVITTKRGQIIIINKEKLKKYL